MSVTDNLTNAVVLIISGITIITLDVVILGKVVDSFMYELTNLNIELTPQFANMMKYPLNIVSIFYYLPLIFSILLIVWGFKIVIFRHKYSYYGRSYFNEY